MCQKSCNVQQAVCNYHPGVNHILGPHGVSLQVQHVGHCDYSSYHLDLQERVSDAAYVMFWGKATHEQAAQDLAQHGNMPSVLIYRAGIYLTDLQHQRCS